MYTYDRATYGEPILAGKNRQMCNWTAQVVKLHWYVRQNFSCMYTKVSSTKILFDIIFRNLEVDFKYLNYFFENILDFKINKKQLFQKSLYKKIETKFIS